MSVFSGMRRPDDFGEAVRALGSSPLVACHNDADGLSAGAILVKTLQRLGSTPETRIVGKGENAYSDAFIEELRERSPSGLIVTDLGVSSRLPHLGVPAILIDHHVPTGVPNHACVISGIDDDPIPTSSLLAYRCAKAANVETDDLLWLAAIGLIGDLAEDDGFPEMTEAKRLGITALRKAASLVNAPRRSASGDASAALQLLLKADGAKAVLSGEHAETAELLAAKEEVKAALDAARKIAPRVSSQVALIPFSSPCQIHPLVAQAWRTRIKDRIVIAANSGYREGWVHFAARTGEDRDIIAFLAEHRPPGAGEEYGNGHRLASGGALRLADWNLFVHSVGFGSELEVAA